MKGKGGTWTYDDLNKFLASPKAFVPGTAMGFAGIPKDSERADVIAYLRSLSDKPGAAADRGEVIFRQSCMDLRTTRRPGIAWPFVYGDRVGCYRDVSPHRRGSRVDIMRKKQRNLSNPCLILGPHARLCSRKQQDILAFGNHPTTSSARQRRSRDGPGAGTRRKPSRDRSRPTPSPQPRDWSGGTRSRCSATSNIPADFKHFDYVNPNAPKGGVARMISIGTFDNFNIAVAGIKGSLAPAAS